MTEQKYKIGDPIEIEKVTGILTEIFSVDKTQGVKILGREKGYSEAEYNFYQLPKGFRVNAHATSGVYLEKISEGAI